MTQIIGCDISEHQGQIDFDALKKQVDFAILRSSFGNGYIDKQFERNQAEARRVGLAIGYYHYAYPQYNAPEAEADWFITAIGKPRDGELLVLDFEENYNGDTVAWCKKFLDHLSSHFGGYKPLIYLNLSQTRNFEWKPIYEANYGFWLADYDHSTSPVATSFPIEALKQFTSSAHFNGVVGNVDEDVFYGDVATFKQYGYHEISPSPATNTMTDDQQRALNALIAFKDTNDLLKGGNYEGAANAAIGAYRDLPGLRTQIEHAVAAADQAQADLAKCKIDYEAEKATDTTLTDAMTALNGKLDVALTANSIQANQLKQIRDERDALQKQLDVFQGTKPAPIFNVDQLVTLVREFFQKLFSSSQPSVSTPQSVQQPMSSSPELPQSPTPSV